MYKSYLDKVFPRAKEGALDAILDNVDLLKRHNLHEGKNLRMFLAQLGHESMGFSRTRELRYKNKTFEDMYGRHTKVGKVLGNIYEGDGEKFHGRGFIQLTGRWNYAHYGNLIGVDLVNEPELAEDFDTALKIAVWYWTKRRLNEKKTIESVTKAINGGHNGLQDRKRLYNLLRDVDNWDLSKKGA